MSRTAIANSTPSDFFSRQSLELTFRLLRNNNPLLAHAIKQTIDSTTSVSHGSPHPSFSGEMLSNQDLLVSLKAHVIGKIVAVLTVIGEQALKQRDLPPSHMALMRSLIEDWVELTEWVLQHTASDLTDRTAYH